MSQVLMNISLNVDYNEFIYDDYFQYHAVCNPQTQTINPNATLNMFDSWRVMSDCDVYYNGCCAVSRFFVLLASYIHIGFDKASQIQKPY